MGGRFLMVGAGLSGAVIGRHLAELGHAITIVDARNHIAGNCHTERDAETGVLVHVYGPHIFHTDDAEVWDYVNRYETFMPYKNHLGRGGLFAAGEPAHHQPVLRRHHGPGRGAGISDRAGRHHDRRSADL
jgi:UDP-galactopyranose mutase